MNLYIIIGVIVIVIISVVILYWFLSKNKNPIACTGDLVLMEGSCQCPAGQIPNGNVCKCPGNLIPVDGVCGCPTGTVKANNTCTCTVPNQYFNETCKTCPANAKVNTQQNSCVCDNPAKSFLDSKCSCASGWVSGTGDDCVCPQGMYSKDGKTCTCKGSLIPIDCDVKDNIQQCCGCPDGMENVNDVCVCTGNQYFNTVSKKCADCPGGSTYKSHTCICDVGNQLFKDGVCQCPTLAIVKDNKCTCPQNMNFSSDKTSCICYNTMQFQDPTNKSLGCVCATGFEWKEDKQTCVCQTGCTCPEGQEMRDNICVCKNGRSVKDNCMACPPERLDDLTKILSPDGSQCCDLPKSPFRIRTLQNYLDTDFLKIDVVYDTLLRLLDITNIYVTTADRDTIINYVGRLNVQPLVWGDLQDTTGPEMKYFNNSLSPQCLKTIGILTGSIEFKDTNNPINTLIANLPKLIVYTNFGIPGSGFTVKDYKNMIDSMKSMDSVSEFSKEYPQIKPFLGELLGGTECFACSSTPCGLDCLDSKEICFNGSYCPLEKQHHDMSGACKFNHINKNICFNGKVLNEGDQNSAPQCACIPYLNTNDFKIKQYSCDLNGCDKCPNPTNCVGRTATEFTADCLPRYGYNTEYLVFDSNLSKKYFDIHDDYRKFGIPFPKPNQICDKDCGSTACNLEQRGIYTVCPEKKQM
jgi:hypothetical protein